MQVVRDTALMVEHAESRGYRGPEAAAQMTIEVGVAKFDLTLYVIETGAGLEGNIEYNTDLFDASTVARPGCVTACETGGYTTSAAPCRTNR